jgi:phosphohistidine phosphatase
MEPPAVAVGVHDRGGRAAEGLRVPVSDFERELTPRGEAQAAFLAERIALVEYRAEVILTSRFPRARSTARAIQAALGCAMVEERGLEVDHDVSEALKLIEREHEAGHKSVMLVGHNPQLGELLGVLASGLPPQEMILKTGELVALEVRPSQMIGSAKIVGRLRLSAEKNEESIAGGVFSLDGGKMQLSMR